MVTKKAAASVKSMMRRAEKLKDEFAAKRDEARELISDLVQLGDDAADVVEALERAIEHMSEIV